MDRAQLARNTKRRSATPRRIRGKVTPSSNRPVELGVALARAWFGELPPVLFFRWPIPRRLRMKSRPWGAFFIGPALVCLETCDPEMTTKETGPKAAFQSRRWVVVFIRPALVCLEAGNLGMTTKKTTPRQLKKAGRGLPFLNGRPWWFAWGYATRG